MLAEHGVLPSRSLRWLARYNTKRRHSRCRHSSPATYENNHTTTTLPQRRNHKSRVHHMGSRPDQTCPAMRGQEAPSSPLWSR